MAASSEAPTEAGSAEAQRHSVAGNICQRTVRRSVRSPKWSLGSIRKKFTYACCVLRWYIRSHTYLSNILRKEFAADMMTCDA